MRETLVVPAFAAADKPRLRVLFVGHRRPVLESLRHMLEPPPQGWETWFSSSTQDALDTMARGAADVVVADMGLPGMGGPALLEAVHELYPQVVRVALLEGGDTKAMLRAAGAAQQYIVTPTVADVLRATLARAHALGTLMASPQLRGVAGELESLPAQGDAYRRLIAEIRAPEPSIRRVGEAIASDVGMTAKILQMANSAFFGLPRRVTSPQDAVVLLGLETVKALALATNVFTYFGESKANVISLAAVRNHSTGVASLAKRIAATQGMERSIADGALIAGLLHDVGKLVLSAKLPSLYSSVLRTADSEHISLVEAEKRLLGSSHAEMGAYLLGLWGFPDSVLQAVAFHHSPQASLTAQPTALTAVHIANIVEHDTHPANRIATPPGYDDGYLVQLGIGEQVPEWVAIAEGKVPEPEPTPVEPEPVEDPKRKQAPPTQNGKR
jgi:putative nucleotidyltransferase with HDIG domain